MNGIRDFRCAKLTTFVVQLRSCQPLIVENAVQSPNTRKFALAILFLSTVRLWASPEIPGSPQSQPIAIVNATVHPITSPTISECTVLFDNGRIVSVGQSVAIPEKTLVVDGTGKHVYPGLFNADGNLGLIEINSVRASDDTGEVGQLNMNVRTEKAINPDSELIPVTRSGGVLFNLTAPSRGLLTGTSAILQLDGWTTEDLTLKAPASMHIRWPRINQPNHEDEEDGEQHDAEHDHNESLTLLEDSIATARIYQQARRANPQRPIDLRWEAMLGVLDKTIPIVAEASKAAQIQSAISFASRHDLKLIIYGGHDAEQCAPLLKSKNVPVIVNGVYRLPMRRHEAYDSAYTLPARLQASGIQFCIAGYARFDASNIRNLPYHAAMAAAFGLDKQDALRAITLWPAEILGVAQQIGSLDAGKHASLIMTDGELFDTATKVTHAWLQGRVVDLSDRHKRLYEKYTERQNQDKIPISP